MRIEEHDLPAGVWMLSYWMDGEHRIFPKDFKTPEKASAALEEVIQRATAGGSCVGYWRITHCRTGIFIEKSRPAHLKGF